MISLHATYKLYMYIKPRTVNHRLTVFASRKSKDLSSTLYKQQFVAKASITKIWKPGTWNCVDLATLVNQMLKILSTTEFERVNYLLFSKALGTPILDQSSNYLYACLNEREQNINKLKPRLFASVYVHV